MRFSGNLSMTLANEGSRFLAWHGIHACVYLIGVAYEKKGVRHKRTSKISQTEHRYTPV